MIRATADAEIRSLIDALRDGPPTRRDAAIARLNVLGSRAVARLIAACDATTDRWQQLAILGILQGSADERAFPIAERALPAGGDLGIAAVGLLHALVTGGNAATHARALDMLLIASNDGRLERRTRAAALDALARAPHDIREAVRDRIAEVGSEADATWDDAVEGRLPEDPAALMEAVDGCAGRAPLPCVLRVIDAVRARETTGDPRQREWQAVRGALHEVAAARGSRVAVYDLRETLDAARASLPLSFLSAAERLGDPSCLDALAAAYSRAEDADWRRELAHAFHALARRLRLTKRHAAMRRALARAPSLGRQ